MFTLIRSTPVAQLVLMQLPAFASSLVIAELFYKFHSFTLECVAFLATWFVIDAVLSRLIGRLPLLSSARTSSGRVSDQA